MQKLTKLFEPGKIGKMVVKNRLIMAPVGTYSAGFNNEITDRIIDYYVARAKAENRIVAELEGIVPEVYTIGDCVEQGYAKEAINEGAEIGRQI